MILFRNSTTFSLLLCRVRTAQAYIMQRNYERSRFRLTQFSTCPWAGQNWSVLYKFISLMPDNSLERKGSSENRNVIWKTYNWFKILQASKMKTMNMFQGCCLCNSWDHSISAP